MEDNIKIEPDNTARYNNLYVSKTDDDAVLLSQTDPIKGTTYFKIDQKQADELIDVLNQMITEEE